MRDPARCLTEPALMLHGVAPRAGATARINWSRAGREGRSDLPCTPRRPRLRPVLDEPGRAGGRRQDPAPPRRLSAGDPSTPLCSWLGGRDGLMGVSPGHRTRRTHGGLPRVGSCDWECAVAGQLLTERRPWECAMRRADRPSGAPALRGTRPGARLPAEVGSSTAGSRFTITECSKRRSSHQHVGNATTGGSGQPAAMCHGDVCGELHP